jgi:hypothetical protein
MPDKCSLLNVNLAVLCLATALASMPASPQNSTDDVTEIDGREWSLVTGSEAVPWSEADEFCETLVAGGFDDWRLPILSELESLHDPAAAQGIRGPFDLVDCCAWSSTNLVALPAGRKGDLPNPAGPPAGYYWGYLFAGGISYYSNGGFPDGFALCTRGPVAD